MTKLKTLKDLKTCEHKWVPLKLEFKEVIGRYCVWCGLGEFSADAEQTFYGPILDKRRT